ncbi:NAD(P)H nitroreductase [Blastochloris sulfoviridis]|nr:NAD(P)H nitroreductase [Blastochloris sulfoviridis]
MTLLLERRSCAKLTSPGPAGDQLAAILRAGMQVPDFQHLRPWEFIVAADDGRNRLGELMRQAAEAAGEPGEVIERAARMPLRAPVVIIVASRFRPHPLVNKFEQQLSAGCAVMAMQMAALAQGFNGIWRSGWPMFNRHLHAALGLGDEDQIIGFLYLGTAEAPPPPARDVDITNHIRAL